MSSSSLIPLASVEIPPQLSAGGVNPFAEEKTAVTIAGGHYAHHVTFVVNPIEIGGGTGGIRKLVVSVFVPYKPMIVSMPTADSLCGLRSHDNGAIVDSIGIRVERTWKTNFPELPFAPQIALLCTLELLLYLAVATPPQGQAVLKDQRSNSPPH